MALRFFSQCASKTMPLSAWIHSFYSSPTTSVRQLGPAVNEMFKMPADKQLLTGAASMSTAWFLSHAFRHISLDERLELLQGWHVLAQEGGPEEDEKVDTVLRGLYLMNDEDTDNSLQQQVDGDLAYLDEFVKGTAAPAAEVELRRGMIKSLLPPPPLRQRKDIWSWPLPVFDLSAFESTVLNEPFPIYACTRSAYVDIAKLRTAKTKSSPEFDRLLPLVAANLSGSIKDSLWSVFFATGNPACVFRLVDIAACSLEKFCDSFAPTVPAPERVQAFVSLLQSSKSGDFRDSVGLLRTKNVNAILYHMAGVSAAWSLIANARKDDTVHRVLATARQALQTRVVSGAAVSPEEQRAYPALEIIANLMDEEDAV